MAASEASELNRELAFEAFKAEFRRNGSKVPDGLIALLQTFTLKPRETPSEGRARLYKRLWCILWFGSKKSLGSNVLGGEPTYVYPQTLKEVIREIIPGNLVDHVDPTHSGVYKVNIGELSEASCPVRKIK